MALADIFQYAFMRRAFVVGILLAIIIPCIGVIVILKRLSMIGDALAHTSLAGVAGGLLMGINPVVGALVTSVAAALGIEAIRKKIPRFSELSIAITLSAGVGLAGVLSGLVKTPANFDSFLFGSIVSISDFEMWMVAAVSAVVLLVFLLLYRVLFFISMDERGAALAGVPAPVINVIFTVLTAVTVSVAGRTVGALIVSSLMVIPVACGMQFGKSFKKTVVLSVLFAVFFTIAGLLLSFYVDMTFRIGLKPGATIVLLGTLVLVLILLGKYVGRRKMWR